MFWKVPWNGSLVKTATATHVDAIAQPTRPVLAPHKPFAIIGSEGILCLILLQGNRNMQFAFESIKFEVDGSFPAYSYYTSIYLMAIQRSIFVH